MNQKEMTKSVMEKVVNYEKKRSTEWIWKFRAILGIALLLLALLFWRIIRQVIEGGSLDLLEIFLEDAEIIREFWQENVIVFFEELPQGAVVLLIALVVFSISFIVLTRKTRKIVRRRLSELSKKG